MTVDQLKLIENTQRRRMDSGPSTTTKKPMTNRSCDIYAVEASTSLEQPPISRPASSQQVIQAGPSGISERGKSMDEGQTSHKKGRKVKRGINKHVKSQILRNLDKGYLSYRGKSTPKSPRKSGPDCQCKKRLFEN
ncbi:hypothetical protein J6590_081650 [Homalodisca vitripennis]|nr:hypothetical protein J6590_081650 [Homalodisca vitripennis]